MKIPYKVKRQASYRIEWYVGNSLDYMKVYNEDSGVHIATFYSEQELTRFLTN